MEAASKPITGPQSKWLHLIRYFRDPLGHYQRLRDQHGDPFKVPFLLGNEMVVTGEPEGIREIFALPYHQFISVDQTENPFFGRNALVTLAGEEHRKARKLLAPHFHGQRIKSYGETIQTTTLEHASNWPQGAPFPAVQALQQIALVLILKTVFGVLDPKSIQEFSSAIHELRGKVGFWVVFIPALRRDLGPWSPWAKFIKARDQLDSLIYAQIAKRRQNSETGDDILVQLIRAQPEEGEPFSDDQIRDHLLTLLAAGQSTSATAAAWALYWMFHHSEIGQKVTNEVRSLPAPPKPDDLARLPYLDAVCKEALRIHPIAVEVARRLKEPITLKGRAVPAGSVLSAAIYLAHHNPEVFPNPSEFRPERFLERSFTPYEYLPFGGGVRVCIGAHMGAYMVRVILGTLLASYDISLASAAPIKPVWKEGILEPKGGVPIVMKPRPATPLASKTGDFAQGVTVA